MRRGFSLARDQKPWAPLGAGAHPELPVLSGLAGSALNRAAGLVPALHRFSTFLRGAPVRKPVLPPDPWLWLPAFEDACSFFFFAFNDVVNMLILLYELCGHSARLLIWKLLSP